MREAEVNVPEMVSEVTAAFRRYEAALVGNDIAVLNELFRASPHTIRYGAGATLYGHEAPRSAPRGPRRSSTRTLEDTVVTTFGQDFATASTLFRRMASPGQPGIGRQTQSWARFKRGRRIVAAYVSVLRAG
jgi:1-carboxybiuret hydrolase subunit AtzH-like protein